ncbi:transglycosylase SLT domain-containing protein [Celerinatantimonas yamalensis]|uniref:Transglycosylase SLT domain-containing protein n=1 Tax=Celerinatantimonas yamalensis TaxID=559956 RepID=A0ABW9G7X6_9GAMM
MSTFSVLCSRLINLKRLPWRVGVLATGALLLTGCATSPPRNPNNLCDIFREYHGWYESAKAMHERWGTPVQVPMAFIYQESRFRAKAIQPMNYFLGFIPTGRKTSAYGYAQAQDDAWHDYQRETGRYNAERDDFSDAIDFIGWFTYKTYEINGVSKWDAKDQYLNYHEGWGGYRRGTYKKKTWLIHVAQQVDKRARRYGAQYRQCKDELNHGWLYRLFFG